MNDDLKRYFMALTTRHETLNKLHRMVEKKLVRVIVTSQIKDGIYLNDFINNYDRYIIKNKIRELEQIYDNEIMELSRIRYKI